MGGGEKRGTHRWALKKEEELDRENLRDYNTFKNQFQENIRILVLLGERGGSHRSRRRYKRQRMGGSHSNAFELREPVYTRSTRSAFN